MSATGYVAQVKAAVEKIRQLAGKLSELHPSENQWNELASLGPSISQEASQLHREIEDLRGSRSSRILEESKALRLRGSSAREEVLKDGLKQAAMFRRNISTIFKGPADTVFDSKQAKGRKESTRERCKTIQTLSSDGVLSWSVAYPPSQWAAGDIAGDIFECLIDNIEPDEAVTWPLVILDTLELLGKHDIELQASSNYEEFLKSVRGHCSRPSRKRKRIETAEININRESSKTCRSNSI
jgi:hypothetical protein